MAIDTTNALDVIASLGFKLEQPPQPLANYVHVRTGSGLMFISGQLPIVSGCQIDPKFVGKVVIEVSTDDAKSAIELCVLNILNNMYFYLGESFDRITGCMKLEVFVNSDSDFKTHSTLANGASDLLCKVLGSNGKHARTTIGVSSLPLGSCVEVAATFLLSN